MLSCFRVLASGLLKTHICCVLGEASGVLHKTALLCQPQLFLMTIETAVGNQAI
jgi:hypothetical protein